MENADASFAQKYHENTKHSEFSIRMSGHLLDWGNRPFPFKVYEGLPSVPLPRDFEIPKAGALQAVSSDEREGKSKGLSLADLAELLFFSAGLTRRVKYGNEVLYMRAASATGALYPIELYVICERIQGLNPGVYHFNPLDFTLVRLREGDYRGTLASVSEANVAAAPITLALTSVAWRNAWKYEARSYRHWFWDAGVIVANLLSVAWAMNLKARVLLGFVDGDANRLLGLQNKKEATVLLTPIVSRSEEPEPATPEALNSIEPKVRPLSNSEVEYPEIWELHSASSLHSPAEVKRWMSNENARIQEEQIPGPTFPLDSPHHTRQSGAKLGDSILRRGSTRKFAIAPIAFPQLSTILWALKAVIPFDFLSANRSLIDTYMIVNDVGGLPSGSYFFDPTAGLLRLLKRGQLRRLSAYLCLDQPLLGQASVVFFLMTPLESVLRTFGNRGYRAAQLEGGVRAGKIYLSAYSVGLGASGSTFYDDAVTEFFSPHAKEKSTMIAVGVGVPAYRARKGQILPQMA